MDARSRKGDVAICAMKLRTELSRRSARFDRVISFVEARDLRISWKS